MSPLFNRQVICLNSAPPAGRIAHAEPITISRELVHAAKAEASLHQLQDLAHALLRPALLAELKTDSAKVAFWLNVYNALSRHALAVAKAKGSLLLQLSVLRRFVYSVALSAESTCTVSLNDIEHGILRCNARAPLGFRRPFSLDDPRLSLMPSRRDPRIHFALNCGATSCPPIRSYSEDGLEGQLELATSAYIAAECRLNRQRRSFTLPRLCSYYATDFGDLFGIDAFCRRYLSAEDQAWLKEHDVELKFGSYDWTIVRPHQ